MSYFLIEITVFEGSWLELSALKGEIREVRRRAEDSGGE